MMNMSEKTWFLVVLSMVSVGVAQGRSPLHGDAAMYTQGSIAGRVRTIEAMMKDGTLQPAKGKELLSAEYVNARNLGFTALAAEIAPKAGVPEVAPAVTQQRIKALAEAPRGTPVANVRRKEQAKRQRAALDTAIEGQSLDADAAVQEDMAVAPLDGEASADAIKQYALLLLNKAAVFSDMQAVRGMPTVSQYRKSLINAFGDEMNQSEAVLKTAQAAIKVTRSVVEAGSSSAGLSRFIERFKKHLSEKYGLSADGIEQEIFYKFFEILSCMVIERESSAADTVGDFIDIYNEYMTQNALKITRADLSFPIGEWAAKILSSPRSSAYLHLLMSFSMEQVKGEVKREPLLRQVGEALQSRITAACALLKQGGEELSPEEEVDASLLATRCADVVSRRMSTVGDMLSPEEREEVDRYNGLSEQLNQLVHEYTTGVETVALGGIAAQQRERFGDGDEQQSSMAGGMIDEFALSDHADELGEDEAPAHKGKMRTSTKILIALAVVVAAGAVFMYRKPLKKAIESLFTFKFGGAAA